MPHRDLDAQVQELFADTDSEPEVKSPEADLPLEETILGLLENKAEAEPVVAEPPIAASPQYVPFEIEELQELPAEPSGREMAPAAPGAQEAPSRKLFNLTTLRTLLRVATAGGAILLIFLLVRLVWQWPAIGNGLSYALYFGAYAVIFVITLLQWMINSSLTKALQEAEKQSTEERQRSIPHDAQTRKLVRANAQLQRRAAHLQAAAQVSQSIATIHDPDQLIQTAVDLIRERFDVHYVGLLLIDGGNASDVATDQPDAILQVGTGEAGKKMVEEGYRVKVGETSPVGWCIAHAQARAIPDPATPPSRRQSLETDSLLPGVRAQLALPLRAYDQVIGALDIQSKEREFFSEEDIAILQTVAAQIAVALDNAQALAELQAELEETKASPVEPPAPKAKPSPLASRPTVTSYERVQPDADAHRLKVERLDQIIAQAIVQQKLIVQSDRNNSDRQATLVAPIRLRGEAIGALGLRETEERYWTEDEVALVEAIADQMALAIENARLLRETRQRAEREHLTADVSAKVRASTDIDNILRTAIRELGQAMRVSEGVIQLGIQEAPDSSQMNQAEERPDDEEEVKNNACTPMQVSSGNEEVEK